MYTKAIAKINDQKLFAVKIRNIADTSNKRRKINKSSISAIFSFLIRNLRPLRLLNQLFWKGFEKFKTQSMRLIC